MKRTSQFHPQTIHFNYNTRDIVENILTFLKCVTKHTKIHRCTQWPKNKVNTFALLYSTPSWKLILCWILIFWQKFITNKLCGFEVGKFLLHFHSILDSNLTQAPSTNGQPQRTSNGFPVPLSKCQDNTSNKATSASFHSRCYSQSSNLYLTGVYLNFIPCFI